MYLRQELLYASAFMFLNVGSHYKLTLGGMTSCTLTLMSPLSDQLACEGSYHIPKKNTREINLQSLEDTQVGYTSHQTASAQYTSF